MSKRKMDLKCLYCSNILKDPIELPCGDTICSEHLDKKAFSLKKELQGTLDITSKLGGSNRRSLYRNS